jgi:hypothetical protein
LAIKLISFESFSIGIFRNTDSHKCNLSLIIKIEIVGEIEKESFNTINTMLWIVDEKKIEASMSLAKTYKYNQFDSNVMN